MEPLLCRMIKEAFQNSSTIGELNETLITVILENLRPINPCNVSSYKAITKQGVDGSSC